MALLVRAVDVSLLSCGWPGRRGFEHEERAQSFPSHLQKTRLARLSYDRCRRKPVYVATPSLSRLARLRIGADARHELHGLDRRLGFEEEQTVDVHLDGHKVLLLFPILAIAVESSHLLLVGSFDVLDIAL